MRKSGKEGGPKEKAMCVLVPVGNITLIYLQDYVSSNCVNVTGLFSRFPRKCQQNSRERKGHKGEDRRRQVEEVRIKGGKQGKGGKKANWGAAVQSCC